MKNESGMSAVTQQTTPQATVQKRSFTIVLRDLLNLFIKIMMIFGFFWILFTFVFGLHRNLSVDMRPSLRDGDLIFYYRLQKKYVKDDIIMISAGKQTKAERIIAVAGDTVDIDEKGLIVNGSYMQEPDIFYQTECFEDGVTFPITIGANQVFVLGDYREHATDSRIYGCINISDIKGKVVGILRRRNL